MPKICKLTVVDEVNVCLTGVDSKLHKALRDKYKRFVPAARFSPKFQMGKWDGYIDFYKSGWTFVNVIDDEFLSIIKRHGYEINFVDNRTAPIIEIPQIEKNYFDKLDPNTTFELRDHQTYAVNRSFDTAKGIFVMATGAGKTATCAAICHEYAQFGKVLMMVPTIDLVTQTAKAFRKLGVEDVGEFNGNIKELGNITITTWQSLNIYREILDGVVCVIGDECHKLKSDLIQEILTVSAKNVPYRFGFTGTLPKDDLGKMSLKISFGEVLYEKTAYELQQEGLLSHCHINMVGMNDGKIEFEEYSDELEFLTKDPVRIAAMAELFNVLSQDKHALILVDRIKLGERLHKLIPGSVFIRGASSQKDREAAYESLALSRGAPTIASFGIASTGIDVPKIDLLIMVEPGKAYDKIIQSIGRALRLADSKDMAEIVDVHSSTAKFSKAHSRKRQKYYKEAKYPYTQEIMDYRGSKVDQSAFNFD